MSNPTFRRPSSPPLPVDAAASRPKHGPLIAVAICLLLTAASWIWCAVQIEHGASPTSSLRNTRTVRHGMNLAWHLLLGTLGVSAIGAGFRHLRRSREALMASEERYRLISSVAMDYVFSSEVRPDGSLELQWVAGAFEKITGFSFDEYIALGGWRARLHPDDRERDDLDMRALRSNQPLRSELRTIAKNGQTIWVAVFAHPVWNEKENRLCGIYGAVQDITRRKQAEAETQATYDTLNDFVDSVPAFGSFVDTEERYQFVNRYHENWFKESRQRFIGRRLSEVHRPSTYAFMRPHSQQALAGEKVRYEHEMTGRDGKPYCFDVQYIPRRASDGTVLGYFSLVFDITERVQRDRQLLRAQRLESVGRLASGIAHDLNNILSPVLMAPDLLREAVNDPAALRILDLVEISARRGASILKQLLMFGRGEQEICASLDLGPLIREMVKIIVETFPKNISVRHHIPSDLPAIQGNVTHLHQVLMNLCINARDAMPDGGRLSLTAQLETVDAALAGRHPGARPGPHVVLGVEDTGTGIPAEIQDKIFDPFFTTKPMGQGTGLGLSTVLGIVQSHHGFIRVDTPPDGPGTRFRIFLPAGPAPAPAEPRGRRDAPPQGNGERILLVDDEEPARRVTRQMLERNAYLVVEAANGREALELYRQDPARFHLTITDLMMPTMDGVTLLRHLREITPDAKAIAVTGGLSHDEMARAMEAESAAFILKPFGADILLETVRRVLRG